MTLLRINCFTNLDEYKREEWPAGLPDVPQVGQSITARSGKRLRVVAVTWLFDGSLRVELHR